MKRDGRNLDKKTLEEFRVRAVECLIAGETPETISRILGVDVSAIYKWKRMFDANGWEGLRAASIPGRPRSTNKEMESCNSSPKSQISFRMMA
jgi:transposase